MFDMVIMSYMDSNRERKPALTQRVLRGVIAATSALLAGDMSDYPSAEAKEIEDADQWARRMREWKQARVTK